MGEQATADRCVVRLGARGVPRYRLFCVPYAGAGTTVYRDFPQDLPDWVEVWALRLPGRESRLAVPPLTDLGAVVEELVEGLTGGGPLDPTGTPPLPYAMFGHSMGALVCFALARAMRHRGLPEPAHLFVSGRRAPHLPDELPSLHRLPQADFLAEVRRLGGIPDQVYAEPGLIELLAPTLQADFAVCETYRHQVEPPLTCSISTFGGESDPTTSPHQLAAWQAETSGRFTARLYSGDHFFLHAHRARILADIGRDIAGDTAAKSGGQRKREMGAPCPQ
jgi:medium-chain acyl-[acyl-carrier-protein] hydrolase